MGKDSRIIRTEMGNGLVAVVPYGISVDVFADAQKLSNYVSKLARGKRSTHPRKK
jgi:hypothetical protein